MTIKEYIDKYLPEALKVEKLSGISAIAMLAQSAGETGWKESPGNMMFGIKDIDGINGNEQLIKTTEYLPTPNIKFPKIYSVTPVKKNGKTMYKYIVDDWFRKYDTPADSFAHYADFIFKNPRYKKALEVRDNPELYLRELARAKYATALNYEDYLINMLNTIKKRL